MELIRRDLGQIITGLQLALDGLSALASMLTLEMLRQLEEDQKKATDNG